MFHTLNCQRLAFKKESIWCYIQFLCRLQSAQKLIQSSPNIYPTWFQGYVILDFCTMPTTKLVEGFEIIISKKKWTPLLCCLSLLESLRSSLRLDAEDSLEGLREVLPDFELGWWLNYDKEFGVWILCQFWLPNIKNSFFISLISHNLFKVL